MNCANHPDRERKAFCQNCGKPLCVECARTVGQAVFCEPCLELRLAAANVASTSVPPGGNSTASATGYDPVATAQAPFASTPSPLGSPNPGVAFALGFIPGVGAMYNGQYAKGVVHLIVFAILVSLADQNAIFGLFVAAWIAYQAFEAYHTARARRDGTPIPNPFGLNDIGERLGFGRSWPPPSTPSANPFSGPDRSTTPPPTYGASPYPSQNPAYRTSPAADPAPPFTSEPPVWGAPADIYGAAPSPIPQAIPSNRFPVGAIVLIGLGVLFLVGSSRMFVGLPFQYLLPILLIGSGVYLFVRRMTSSGVGFVDDGSGEYRLRLVRALQSSVWVVLVGILFLLDDLHILSWGRSWPLFIIVGGVMAFVQRSAHASVSAPAPPPSYAPFPPQAPSAHPEPETAIIPREREGL